MMIPVTEKASEVRQHFSQFVDDVVREHRPGFFTRNRDILATLSVPQLKVLVDHVDFHADVEPDGQGGYVGTLRELDDLIASASTREGVINALTDDLIDYAQEYLGGSFALYFRAPNRAHHFAYVLKVGLQDSRDDVRRLIHAEPS